MRATCPFPMDEWQLYVRKSNIGGIKGARPTKKGIDEHPLPTAPSAHYVLQELSPLLGNEMANPTCPFCHTPLYNHPDGGCLDAWVAHLFGWKEIHLERDCYFGLPPGEVRQIICIRQLIPNWSTVWADTEPLLDTLASLVGDFQYADGYFHLTYSDGGHGDEERGCDPYPENYDAPEGGGWSAHCHLGLIGGNSKTPEYWDHNQCYCALAQTKSLAVVRAFILAFTPPKNED